LVHYLRLKSVKPGQPDACLYKRAMASDRWHCPAEHACMPRGVFVKINGETHYLWWASDHGGKVLETFVTKCRDRKAALEFIRKQ
jgi:transposase-like protein